MGKTRKQDKKSPKKKHKHKEHKSRKKCKKLKKETIYRLTSKEKPDTKESIEVKNQPDEQEESFAIPVALMNNKSHAPETQQEFERRQSQIRRVKDEVTGRIRLIKGDGEVLEEIVSKQRHTGINRAATQADGRFFEGNTVGKSKTRRK